MTFADRFWAKVRKGEGCWEWTATRIRSGYGHVRVGRRLSLAHRVSWEIHFGAIPDGLCVLHHCDNPPCVRPDHLFLGTVADNSADMVVKGRQCRGEHRPAARLAADDVACARALNRAGASQHSLARAFGISHTSMRRALLGTKWRSVEAPAGERRRDVTHCPRGHEYTPGNTLRWGSRGTFRKCRACRSEKRVAK